MATPQYASSKDVSTSGEAARSVKSLGEEATAVMCKMLEEGAKARAARFDDIRKNEDSYFFAPSKALKGRSNIPFDGVVMGGFMDTLMSNVQEGILLKFNPTREQDKMAADKISAAYDRESGVDRGNWDDTFLNTKLLAALSGVGFNKMTFESTPHFNADFSAMDHYDMVVEAKGGNDIDKHEYKFQMNIFRTEDELKEGISEGFYDKLQVRKFLTFRSSDEMVKKALELYQQKNLRYASLGMETTASDMVGQTMHNFVEGVVRFKGKWYFAVFSYIAKAYIRFEPLENVFEHAKEFPGRGAWTAWHTNPHPFLFWTKAPADDVRPIGYAMKKAVNYMFDNYEKSIWNQRAYNPKMFTDPSQLLWRQDGLVRAQIKPGENIANGIYEFQTADKTGITINMIQWLDNYLGQKNGLNADAQGNSQTDRVGIAVQNIQQVSKRFMLANKRYRHAAAVVGSMFDYGCYEYLREKYAVKILGPKGAQWEEEITSKDTDCTFTVSVKSGNEEEQKNEISAEKRKEGFATLEINPALMAKINPDEYLRVKFGDMGFDEETIRALLDVNNDGDADSRAHAAKAITDCLEGNPIYSLYRGATAGFVQRILDFCADNYELIPDGQLAKLSPGQKAAYKKDMLEYDKLVAYATAHIPIAQQNMIRKASSIIAARGIGAPPAPGTPPAPAAPAPAPAAVPPVAA